MPMTLDGLILCDLTSADYPEILALWQRAGLPVHPEGREAPDAFARQLAGGMQRAIALRAASSAAAEAAAAEDAAGAGPALVAAALLTHDGRKGWINRLAVDPGCRRRGLARTLIAEAERWFAQDLGLEVWAALIECGNQASLALFEAAGYGRHDIVYVSKRTRPEA